MPPSPRHAVRGRATSRVPTITPEFWLLKGLSTAMGESTSDYLVHRLGPVPAVLLGLAAFVGALARQLHARRYRATCYWGAVAMVGVFGTMASDVLHVGLHVPYGLSLVAFALVLAAVFACWRRTEHTLSIHSITTARRELFYWAAVMATFALGTAAGDFTAVSLGLGYLRSIALFAGVIAVPALGFRLGHWNAVACFWAAYVATRPLGASIADSLGRPRIAGGLGLGSGWVALVLTLAIVLIVARLAHRQRDVVLAQTTGSPPRATTGRTADER